MNKVIENNYNAIFNHISRLPGCNEHFMRFLKWSIDKGFFDNLTVGDLIELYGDTTSLNLPLLRKDGITIGFSSLPEGGFKVGIDPTRWFDSVSRCSVVITFPFTSKREEKQVYSILESLLDEHSKRHRDWIRESRNSWYGSYLSNAS